MNSPAANSRPQTFRNHFFLRLKILADSADNPASDDPVIQEEIAGMIALLAPEAYRVHAAPIAPTHRSGFVGHSFRPRRLLDVQRASDSQTQRRGNPGTAAG